MACDIKHLWEEFLHANQCHGRTAMGSAWLLSVLGWATIPIVPIFVASDAYVDDEYVKLEAEGTCVSHAN